LDRVDVFISYAREDQHSVARLVRALESRGLNVFWDRDIPAGETFLTYIQSRLDSASVVVVAWSRKSVGSEFVYSEASRARSRGVLLPVLVEAVVPPLGLDAVQAANLVPWFAEPKPSALPTTLTGPLDALLLRTRPSPEAKPAAPTPIADTTELGVADAPRGASAQSRRLSYFVVATGAALIAVVAAFVALAPAFIPTQVANVFEQEDAAEKAIRAAATERAAREAAAEMENARREAAERAAREAFAEIEAARRAAEEKAKSETAARTRGDAAEREAAARAAAEKAAAERAAAQRALEMEARRTRPVVSGRQIEDWLEHFSWCADTSTMPDQSASQRVMPDGSTRGQRPPSELVKEAVSAAKANRCAVAIEWMIECRVDNPEASRSFRYNADRVCVWLSGQ